MKLYTLGTSHGAAEPGRACSGNLICVDGRSYLFDCGCNAESKMTDLGLPIEATRAVFLSHMHEDHVGGLSGIVKRIAFYHRDAEPIKVFFPEQQAITGFCGWLKAMHLESAIDSRAFFSCVKPETFYKDGCISVTAIPTAHILDGAFPSFAYDVTAANKRLLFTGDLHADFHDFPAVLQREDFDAVVCELVHFKLETALPALLKTRTKHLIFTHVSPYKLSQLEEIKHLFPFEVTVSADNTCFEL